MLISYNIPDLEIHRSKKPVALIVSAGYIIPHSITARGNYFVMNDKKVKGIYTIIEKFRLMWDYTPVYFFVVQESNPIDPIMIDRINNFMQRNKIVNLKLKDIKHGSMLRSVYLRAEREGLDQNAALRILDSTEKDSADQLNTKIDEAVQKLNEHEKVQREEYNRPYYKMSDNKKSYRLLKFLKEKEQLISEQEYTTFIFKVENHLLDFSGLVEELRESHVVRIVEPLDEETESFIYQLSNQYEEEKAGQTQDLVGTKRGLKEMLSRPIHSILSFYAMIPASVLCNVIPNIEIHPAFPTTPIALIITHGKIIRKKITRNGSYFVVKDRKIRGVYSKINECQYMWGKVPCYIYGPTGSDLSDKEFLNHIAKYVNRKEFARPKIQERSYNEKIFKKRTLLNFSSKSKNINPKLNSLLEHLLNSNKISQDQFNELQIKVNNREIDPDELIEELIRLGLVNTISPLNLGVRDFIKELGAVNAQEWAGITQDCRNIFKGLNEMTSKPVKQFLSAGVILAIGLAVTIAAVVIPSNLPEMMKGLSGGSGHGGGFSLIPNFSGHFIDGLFMKFPWMVGLFN